MIKSAKINRNVQAALSDKQLQKNLRNTLATSLQMRDVSVAEVPNWDELSQYARDVKLHTLSRLDYYLEMFERKVVAQGGKVIWAETGQDAVEFVVELAQERKIKKLVKSKSMLSEEIHLNATLEQMQIESIETDLGEYIVQLAGETPSHLLAPALHKSKEEIADLFAKELGMEYSGDVDEITATARQVLRKHFLDAPLGVTGVNFGVAETGSVVIVENEGNARLSVSVPKIHIALMGIEKVIPRASDLAVFLKLLIRSATGQKITSYVNCLNGPRRPEELAGPDEFYLVLVDNGRSKILADEFLRQTLACIRCGACQNVCPVYQRIGGHAYESTYQGPIGAILTPQLTSHKAAPEHAFTSSLCGACQEICPVGIEIPHILLKLREQAQNEKNDRASTISVERLGIVLWTWVMCNPRLYVGATRWARRLWRVFEKNRLLGLLLIPLSRWSKHRAVPHPAPHSFRELYRLSEDS